MTIDVFAHVRGWAPPELMGLLDQLVLLFPEQLKTSLKQVIDTLPREGDHLYRILELVRGQWKDIQFKERVRIAVVGPSGTGKTSLVKAMSRWQAEPEVSIFPIIDVQGLEEFLGYQTRWRLPAELQESDVILLVLDGRYELSESTVQMHERLRDSDKPVLVLLNKMDLVESPSEVMRAARNRLKTSVSGTSGGEWESIEKLLKAIVVANPRTLYPLAQQFADFRRALCQRVVTQSAIAALLVAAVPIPVSDLLPLIAIQTAMILKIGRAFGCPITRDRARELLPILAAGVLVRKGSHRLRLLFPGQQSFIAVSIAGLWTWTLGQAALGYFEKMARFLENKPVVGVGRDTFSGSE